VICDAGGGGGGCGSSRQKAEKRCMGIKGTFSPTVRGGGGEEGEFDEQCYVTFVYDCVMLKRIKFATKLDVYGSEPQDVAT
jgi:hypothetical protein